MKKKNLNPLNLDKETIAKLNEEQIDAIAGGKKRNPDDADESNGCDNSCNGNGGSCNKANELQQF